MRRFKIMLLLVGAVIGFTAAAEVDFGIWKDVPAGIEHANVEGVRFGLPFAISSGKVEGAELSIFFSGTSRVEGLKFILFGANHGSRLEGGSIGLLNIAEERLDGIQIGAINSSGHGGIQLGCLNHCDDDALFQLGLLNINRNGWLPVMIFFNFGSKVFGD